jgi:5,10-methylenetetrahydrofolate reductase
LFNELAKLNVLYKVYMLMRITPPKSLKVAQILYNVPGIYLPKAVMEQMKTADQAGNAQEDGIQVALSSFHKIKVVHRQGIAGIDLMPVGWFEVIPRIIMEADLLPRSSTVQASMH